MKKPKKKKYPKKPKQSSSNESKKNYLARIKEIDSDFAKAEKEYTKEVADKKKLNTQVAAVRR
jgi:hypothetical protein